MTSRRKALRLAGGVQELDSFSENNLYLCKLTSRKHFAMAKKDSKQKIEAKAKGILGNWIVRNLLLAALLIVGLLLLA